MVILRQTIIIFLINSSVVGLFKKITLLALFRIFLKISSTMRKNSKSSKPKFFFLNLQMVILRQTIINFLIISSVVGLFKKITLLALFRIFLKISSPMRKNSKSLKTKFFFLNLQMVTSRAPSIINLFITSRAPSIINLFKTSF